MKLDNANITILINQDSTTIEIYDQKSSTRILSVTLTPEHLSMALSRLGHTPCEVDIITADTFSMKINKQHENKSLDFQISNALYDKRDIDTLHEQALKACPDGGWIPDKSYNSQGSFFTDMQGNKYARTTIRRWI